MFLQEFREEGGCIFDTLIPHLVAIQEWLTKFSRVDSRLMSLGIEGNGIIRQEIMQELPPLSNRPFLTQNFLIGGVRHHLRCRELSQ